MTHETLPTSPMDASGPSRRTRRLLPCSQVRPPAAAGTLPDAPPLVASTGTAYSLGYGSMCPDLGCTDFRATIGLSMYNLGFGIVPLFTSSLSEEVGRQPLYYVSAVGFLSMFVLIAECVSLFSTSDYARTRR